MKPGQGTQGATVLRQVLELLRVPARSWKDEPRLAGRVGGGLYLAAGLAAASLWAVPHIDVDHPALLLAVTAAAIGWGALSTFVIDWARMPFAVLPAGTLAGIVAATLLAIATGGASSPVRGILTLTIVYAAWFLSTRLTLVTTLLTSIAYAVTALVQATTDNRGADIVISTTVYFSVAIVLLLGRALLQQHKLAADRLSEEHELMRDLATTVARGASLEELLSRAAVQLRELCGGDAAAVLAIEGDRNIIRGFDAPTSARLPVGHEGRMADSPMLRGIIASGTALRRDGDLGPRIAALGYNSIVVAPVQVGRRPWGVIVVGGIRPLPDDALRRLEAVAELIGLAVGNAEAEEQLTTRASTDALTGLSNHRTFHERLRAELARSRRHARPLALALIDVDHFKEVNDHLGHATGDRVLQLVAQRLREVARAEDLVARVGGDEFALLMPETTEEDAERAVERARRAVAEDGEGSPAAVQLSAGICGIEHAADADTLVRLADGALYWAKAHGRDRASVYDPDVVRELSATERAENLRRSQGMLGLRALARAIDAKDPSTRRHAERVAELACAVAEQLGWPADRVRMLEEAALLHDVGKIGVPDAILLKPGRLDPAEYAQVKEHAALGARIVEDVLDPEQVSWVRWHHERPDGRGYPDGIAGDSLPLGAAILACCDAFDVMTADRPYSRARPVAEALDECERLAGVQFDAGVVRALRATFAMPGARAAAA